MNSWDGGAGICRLSPPSPVADGWRLARLGVTEVTSLWHCHKVAPLPVCYGNLLVLQS